MFQASLPLFDSGLRSGQRLERQAALDRSRATLGGAVTDRALGGEDGARSGGQRRARRSSAPAPPPHRRSEVVDIIDISFRAGAATNIEVIDAERRARDADTVSAIAEDALRRARLDLLTALGLFPR